MYHCKTFGYGNSQGAGGETPRRLASAIVHGFCRERKGKNIYIYNNYSFFRNAAASSSAGTGAKAKAAHSSGTSDSDSARC